MVGKRAPRVGVLALQGGFREHEAAMADVGATVIRVREESDLDDLEGLLIPGGESTTISLLAQRSGLFDPIRTLVSDGIPVYGSCAGMIMLSDRVLDGREDRPSFGGIDIAVRRNAFGRQVASFEADVVMPVIPGDPFPAVFIRAPWVEETTDSVEVLARVADPGSPGRIVAVRQGRLLATSFHPELTPDRRVHQYFLQIVKGDA